ncbi:MAG: response regulator [Pseudomonadota bacterium]|nr:response regulator [Polaromonas sp.]MDQ3271639.1 response regulator [Pseudomonadota bacterium]
MLLDIGMPGMDGYEVARRLRTTSSGSKLLLVAITGWGSENDRKPTKDAGPVEHLTKPVEFDQLEVVLAQLAGRAEVQPKVALS